MTTELPRLSQQQRRVLALISFGKSYAEIAAELHLATDTVKTHAKQAYKALGVHSGAHAIGQCYRLRLFRPPPSDPTPTGTTTPVEKGHHDDRANI